PLEVDRNARSRAASRAACERKTPTFVRSPRGTCPAEHRRRPTGSRAHIRRRKASACGRRAPTTVRRVSAPGLRLAYADTRLVESEPCSWDVERRGLRTGARAEDRRWSRADAGRRYLREAG